MNVPPLRADPEALPERCEVLVVGAGPAGSACAQLLAAGGADVVLVDRQVFPRDKVCGDGLIPDAHAALARLGVAAEVAALAQPAAALGCIGPRGGRIDVPGRLSVLPRRVLDDLLRRAAVRRGVRFFAPWRFEAPLVREGRVEGARLAQRGEMREIAARWVVLATGAVPQALIAAGLCDRRTPSGIALRGYVRNDRLRHRSGALEVVWHRRLKKGYGWIFPCADGLFNVGVGLAHSHAKRANGAGAGEARGTMQDVNLREMFAAFCDFYAPARELMRGGALQGELKGAPLRCSLDGAGWSRPGLLVTGEAAGSTYAFTGEGIGKAMETGFAAAEAILGVQAEMAADARSDPTASTGASTGGGVAVPAADGHDAAVRASYAAALTALKPRFELYERANRINEHPWLADLLIWRANRSPRILRRMEGVLDERNNPGNLVSVVGLLRLFLPIR